jgi:hypothetical protein
VSGVDLNLIERTMHVLAERSPIPFVYDDLSNGQRIALSPAALSSRSGYLPAIVTAGEAVWREATGKGFELDIAPDPETLLGYRLGGIGAGSFTTVMLSSMEAMHQVTGPEAAVVSELNALRAASTERLRYKPVLQPQSWGPRP